MLDNLKKKLGIVPNEENKEAAADKPETVLAVTETEEYKTLSAKFDEQTTLLQAASDKIDALEAQLTQFAEAKAQAEANAKQVKMDARLASLSKEVGDERAAKVLAATEGMDDASFDAIASALKMSAEQEAASSLFTEAGVDAQTKPEARNGESAEMKLIKAKYKQSK